MQNQHEQQNFRDSTQIPPEQNHGGHELFDIQEAVGGLIGAIENYVLYEQHTQDQELKSMNQRHRQFITQMYNTIVDSLKTGLDPAVPTQTYHMDQNNTVIYGMKPSQPKSPVQSVNELTDECISSFMMSCLKSNASAFTMTSLEITNPVLRRIFADSIPNLIEMAYEVFLYQNKNQYYQVPQLQTQDMQELTNSFQPIQGTMPH